MFLVQKKYNELPWIELVIVSSIALFSIGYVTLISDFAEQHMTFSFLNFPIFIGEILLFACLVMSLVLVKRGTIAIERWHYGLLIYILWLLAKVLWGYYTFGPLAFRNAALFYYPLFAVFSYYSFQRLVFGQRTLTVLFFPLALLAGANKVNDYYLWGYLAILFLISFYSGQRWIRRGGFALILWQLYAHHFLLVGSRSHMVGQLATILFLTFFLGAIFIPQRASRWLGPLIGLGVLGILALGLWKWSDANAVKSMLNIAKLRDRYAEFDAEIEQKRADFKSEELHAQLYHSNTLGADGISADKIEAFRKALADQIVVELVDYSDQVSLHTRMTFARDIQSILAQAETAIEERQKELLGQAKASVERFAQATLADTSSLLLNIDKVDMKDFKVDLRRKGDLALANFKETLKSGTVPEFPVPAEPVKMSAYARQVMLGREAVAKPTALQAQAWIKINMDDLVSAASQNAQQAVSKFKSDEAGKSFSRQVQFDESLKPRNYRNLENISTLVSFRSLETAENNIFFRIFIWRDMIREMLEERALLGMNFGKPQRSISLEILGWAAIEWRRDGWITPHNSYLDLIYRSGIIGVLLVLALIVLFVHLVRVFLVTRSWEGGLLMSAILYWMVIANFLVFLELPYNAIPFWSFLGATVAFANRKRAERRPGKKEPVYHL